MKTVQQFFWAHLFAAVIAVSVGYAIERQFLPAIFFAFLGIVWAAARLRNIEGIGGLILGTLIVAGCLGVLLGVSAWLLILMTVSALGAWDLDHFLQRLSKIEHVDYSTGLGRAHLQRLIIVESLGFAAGLLTLFIRTQISFWWMVLLVLLAAISLRRLVSYVRQESEK